MRQESDRPVVVSRLEFCRGPSQLRLRPSGSIKAES